MWIARKVGSQYQSIYKKSDKVFEFDAAAARNRNAYQNVAGPGIEVEKRFKYGKHYHEQRCPLPPAKFRKMVDEFLRNGKDLAGAIIGLLGRPDLIGGKMQKGGCTCQFLFPVSHLVSKQIVCNPLPLPFSVVAILNRQAGEGCGLPSGVLIVESRQFANKYSQRPTVAHNVVHYAEEKMFGSG